MFNTLIDFYISLLPLAGVCLVCGAMNWMLDRCPALERWADKQMDRWMR